MSTEENQTVVRRLTEEAWNQGNIGLLDQILADSFTYHDPASPGVVSRDDYKQYFTALRTTFPDFHITIEDEVADGDKVAARWTVRGTHRGDLVMPQGTLPPTGKPIQVTGMSFFHVAGGKVVEAWLNGDNLGFLHQLGAMPAAEPAAQAPGD